MRCFRRRDDAAAYVLTMLWGAASIIVCVLPIGTQAQTPIASLWTAGRARLFVADNTRSSPGIIVINLPSGNVTGRIALPGTTLQMGLSGNHMQLGVFRARDNDQQIFTVINTGLAAMDPVSGRPPRPPAALQVCRNHAKQLSSRCLQ
jgi:hypothetical protein